MLAHGTLLIEAMKKIRDKNSLFAEGLPYENIF